MVARGAGAAGPVLLACRQWEPLGLARRLPSLGVGAWRSAPLLPWRVHWPVRVCAALAAGSGGSGRYLVLCLFRFPHPAPRVRRCLWRAVPSGCPLPSLAGTPFHAVCASRELGRVALLVVPACPLRVCALALPRRPLPPPWVVWRAHLARSRHWALVGPFHVVRAPPRVLPRSLAPSGVLGGGRSGPGSPLPGLGLLWRGASEVRRSPSPECPPTGRAVGVRYPLAVGAGGCGYWDPSPTPPRALLRAGFARCGGGMRVPGGGASCLGVGRLGSGGLPPPTARPLGGLPGPTTRWLWVRGGAGRGKPPRTPQRALLRAGFARCGGGMRVPGGGASCLGVGRPGSGALPTPTACPLGRLPGPTTHWLWLRGGAGVGTRHQPHSARSCELALRAVGAARGRPRGAPPAWMWGVRGRALSHPRLPVLSAGRRGPLPTGCGCGGVRVWGPVTNPTARALACCGSGLRVRGGGASCLRVGRPGSGALPPPTARPLGGLPRPTTHWLWVRGAAGVGTHHHPHSARSLQAGFEPHGTRSCVLWGRLEGARGGRLLPWCGASGVGRSPTPDSPPSGRAAGAHYPLAVDAGGRGRGEPSPTPQRALLRAGFARCGGSKRAPGAGASCLGEVRPRSGALPAPTARRLGGLPGPTTHWLWVRGGSGVGTHHQPHSARSCVLWGRLEGARGGCLLPGYEASGVGRSPTPDCPPSGWAAGAHYPLAVGAGGCGRGDPSPTPQRGLLHAVGAA